MFQLTPIWSTVLIIRILKILRLTFKLIFCLILEPVANIVSLHSMVLPFIDVDTLTVATETSVLLPWDCNMKLNGAIYCGWVSALLKLVVLLSYVQANIDPVTLHVTLSSFWQIDTVPFGDSKTIKRCINIYRR